MWDTIWAILKFVLPILPIVLAALIGIKVNLKKEKRHHQLVLPVVALIYGIVYLLLVDDIALLLLKGIYYLISRFEFLAFLDKVNWAYGVMYVANTVMILLFMAIKGMLMPLLAAFPPEKNSVTRFLTGLFYDYDEKAEDDDSDKGNNGKKAQSGKWYLKDKLGHAKKVLMAVYIGVIAFSCLLFATTCYLISKSVLSVPFYPAFGILILGEVFFFLGGLPKGGDDEEEIADAPEDEKAEIDYSTLKEIYEKLFGDRISNSVDLPPIENKKIPVAQLLLRYREEYEETGSQEAHLLFKYFTNMLLSGEELDDGLIASARNIIEGKNILFSTPFYEDASKYIFLPITRHLMQNKKILIVVGRIGAEKNITDWFKRGLYGVNNFENIWKTALLCESNEETKIAVLPMKDIYNLKMLNSKAQFLEDTSMVIITDPTRLLGTMQVGLSTVVSLIRRGEKPQYIAFDRNCDGLVDSLSHVLNSSIEEVTATTVASAKSTAILWEADGKNLHHRLGLDTARYLGVGSELAAVAVANKVSEVNWFAYEKFPATDMRWIISQYYGPLCKVMDLPVSQSELEEHVKVSDDLWSMPQGKDRFIIAEDEYNNAYEIIRQFSSRATNQAFIHVLSQNYLLRDYMSENAQIFTYDPKAIPNIAADYQRVRCNMVYKLVMRLMNGEMYEEEIKEALVLMGVYSNDVHSDLTSLIMESFVPAHSSEKIAPESIVNVRTDLVIDKKTRRPERKRVYAITNTLFIDRFLQQLQVVHCVAEDEADKNLYLNSILYGHVYQKYLPGTFTVYDGKYYEVVSVTRNNGIIFRRAADHITKRSYYRQIRTYNVSGFEPSTEAATQTTFGNVVFERGNAEIDVTTDGYFELSDFGNLKSANKVLLNGIPVRKYQNKSIIRVKLTGADQKVRFTIATMMNELFVTLFPEMHEYVVATTNGTDPDKCDGYVPRLVVSGADGVVEDDGYIYIIEDSLIDMGLLINVDRYFTRIMEIITDLLCWHNERLDEETAQEEGGEGPAEEGEGGEDGTEEGGEDGPKKKKGCSGWFGSIFKKKKTDDGVDEGGEAPAEEGEGGDVPESAPEGGEDRPQGGNDEPQGGDGETDAPQEPDDEPEAPASAPDDAFDDPQVPGETAVGGSSDDGDAFAEPQVPGEVAETPQSAPAEDDAFAEPEAPADEPATEPEAPVSEPEAPAEVNEPAPAEEPKPVEEPASVEKPKKKGFFGWLGGLFGKKKKQPVEEPAPVPEEGVSDFPDVTEIPAEELGGAPVDAPAENPDGNGEDANAQDDSVITSGNFMSRPLFNMIPAPEMDVVDDNEDAITGEDEESVEVDSEDAGTGSGGNSTERKKYSQRFFMLYGNEAVPEVFDLEATLKYLKENGFEDNYLKQSRDSAKNTKLKWYNYRYEPGEHYCDFCGTKLEGKISVLKDGRERCNECKKTAINRVRQFKKLYKEAHRQMEEIFGIKIKSKIQIRITNAEEIAKEGGYEFTPTPGFDGRALGFAQRLGNGKTRIMLENGAPKLETEKTLVHEMTHIWQYENMLNLWSPERDLVAIEGMAVWVEAQYLTSLGLEERAKAYVDARCYEDSEYGQGMREYIKRYPLRKGKKVTRGTPFCKPGQNPLK